MESVYCEYYLFPLVHHPFQRYAKIQAMQMNALESTCQSNSSEVNLPSPPPNASEDHSRRGRLHVISLGPAGPAMATLQALNTLQRMAAVAAPPQQVKLFTEYIGHTPILFDPWQGLFDYHGKRIWDLEAHEKPLFQAERRRLRDERVELIRQRLNVGQDVGLLESGNPCIYGPGHWYKEMLALQDVVIVPGMGCDAAALAVLGQSGIPAHNVRFLIQTSPVTLMDGQGIDLELLRDLTHHACTLILYMALRDTGSLFTSLATVLPADMPCAVVYWAGYPERQRVLRGQVDNMAEQLARETEDFMGLLLIGRFLVGKPYQENIRRWDQRDVFPSSGAPANSENHLP